MTATKTKPRSTLQAYEHLLMAIEARDEKRFGELLAQFAFKSEHALQAFSHAADQGFTHALSPLLALAPEALDYRGYESESRPPLLLAAICGHAETCEALLELGADPLAVDDLANTALILAVWCGDLASVQILAPVSNLYARDHELHSALEWAGFRGHERIVFDLMGRLPPLDAREQCQIAIALARKNNHDTTAKLIEQALLAQDEKDDIAEGICSPISLPAAKIRSI